MRIVGRFLSDINIKIKVNCLHNLIKNVKKEGYMLAANFSKFHEDTILIHGSVGVDIIKYIQR